MDPPIARTLLVPVQFLEDSWPKGASAPYGNRGDGTGPRRPMLPGPRVVAFTLRLLGRIFPVRELGVATGIADAMPCGDLRIALVAQTARATVGLIGAIRRPEGLISGRTRCLIASRLLCCHWPQRRLDRCRLVQVVNKWLRCHDEAFPYFGRQRSPGDTLHRAAIVVADPDPDHKCLVESNKPSIPVILAGAGFARRVVIIERRGSPSAVTHNSAQKVCEYLLVRKGFSRARGGSKRAQPAALRSEARYAPWFELRPTGANGSKAAGQVEQIYFIGAKSHAWDFRERSIKPKHPRSGYHLVEAYSHGKTHGHSIDRMRESLRQRHPAILLAAVVFRLPSTYSDRRCVYLVVGQIAFLQGGKINKQLEGGAGLSLRVDSPVELTLVVVTPSDHGDHCSVRSHGDEGALGNAACRAFAFEHLSNDPVG